MSGQVLWPGGTERGNHGAGERRKSSSRTAGRGKKEDSTHHRNANVIVIHLRRHANGVLIVSSMVVEVRREEAVKVIVLKHKLL